MFVGKITKRIMRIEEAKSYYDEIFETVYFKVYDAVTWKYLQFEFALCEKQMRWLLRGICRQ